MTPHLLAIPFLLSLSSCGYLLRPATITTNSPPGSYAWMGLNQNHTYTLRETLPVVGRSIATDISQNHPDIKRARGYCRSGDQLKILSIKKTNSTSFTLHQAKVQLLTGDFTGETLYIPTSDLPSLLSPTP